MGGRRRQGRWEERGGWVLGLCCGRPRRRDGGDEEGGEAGLTWAVRRFGQNGLG
jgi:hypothetical protein